MDMLINVILAILQGLAAVTIGLLVLLLVALLLLRLLILFAENEPYWASGEVKKRNNLWECRKCDRLYRFYQVELVKASKKRSECPHCEKYIDGNGQIKNPDKWMDSHVDCPKISVLSYLKVLRTIEVVKKLRLEKEEIDRFEKYNNLEPNVDWIKKLQKDLSK